MVIVKREGVILEATENEFENQAVLNPTVVQQGDIFAFILSCCKRRELFKHRLL